jgi:hypothetical protein
MPKNTKKAARRRKTQGIEGTDLDASTKEIDVVSKYNCTFYFEWGSCSPFQFTHCFSFPIFLFRSYRIHTQF